MPLKIKLRKNLLHPYVILGISLFATLIVDFIIEAKIWITIGISAWKGITWTFNSNLAVWLAIVILYIIVFFKFYRRKIKLSDLPLENKHRLVPMEIFKPEFVDYNEDVVNGLKRKWNWKQARDGEYYPDNITVICKECGIPLMIYLSDPLMCACENENCKLYLPIRTIDNNIDHEHLQCEKESMYESGLAATIMGRVNSGTYKEVLLNSNPKP